jgi:hypothetical protein
LVYDGKRRTAREGIVFDCELSSEIGQHFGHFGDVFDFRACALLFGLCRSHLTSQNSERDVLLRYALQADILPWSSLMNTGNRLKYSEFICHTMADDREDKDQPSPRTKAILDTLPRWLTDDEALKSDLPERDGRFSSDDEEEDGHNRLSAMEAEVKEFRLATETRMAAMETRLVELGRVISALEAENAVLRAKFQVFEATSSDDEDGENCRAYLADLAIPGKLERGKWYLYIDGQIATMADTKDALMDSPEARQVLETNADGFVVQAGADEE